MQKKYLTKIQHPEKRNSHSENCLVNKQMEKAMAPHCSSLAWKIPRTEEPGRLQSMGSLGVGHAWATSLSVFTFMHWRRKWQPTPVFLPGESQGRGAWWAAVYRVTQSRTQLKWLSSSSILTGVRGYVTVVSICITLITGNIECLLSIFMTTHFYPEYNFQNFYNFVAKKKPNFKNR